MSSPLSWLTSPYQLFSGRQTKPIVELEAQDIPRRYFDKMKLEELLRIRFGDNYEVLVGRKNLK